MFKEIVGSQMDICDPIRYEKGTLKVPIKSSHKELILLASILKVLKVDIVLLAKNCSGLL